MTINVSEELNVSKNQTKTFTEKLYAHISFKKLFKTQIKIL